MPSVLPSQLLIDALRENDLVPTVIPENFAPSVELSVEFSGKRFTPAEKLTKEETSEEPKISFIDTDDIVFRFLDSSYAANRVPGPRWTIFVYFGACGSRKCAQPPARLELTSS